MRFIVRVFGLLIWATLAGFLYYTLPQHDIVRIVENEVNEVTPDRWNRHFYADSSMITRDMQFIRTFKADGDQMVYRNEDTGWWPPYFKFDTQNLQTRAADYVSSTGEPVWVAVRHYGVRSTWFSIFPNALDVYPVDGPDHRIIPWFNIIFLTVLVLFGSAIYIRWRRFRENRIEPVLEGIDDGFDAAGERVGRIGRWFRKRS